VADETVYPEDRYDARWRVSTTRPLDGTVQVGFAKPGGKPTGVTWTAGVWVSGDSSSTVREFTATVAGSVAKQPGDAHPGPGTWDVYAALTSASGQRRTWRAGRMVFQ
jgi:hypothetical protein